MLQESCELRNVVLADADKLRAQALLTGIEISNKIRAQSYLAVDLQLHERYGYAPLTSIFEALQEQVQICPTLDLSCEEKMACLFAQAKRLVGVDLKIHSLSFWISKVVSYGNGALPRQWVERELFLEHRSLLKDSGAPLDIPDESDGDQDSDVEVAESDPPRQRRPIQDCQQARRRTLGTGYRKDL